MASLLHGLGAITSSARTSLVGLFGVVLVQFPGGDDHRLSTAANYEGTMAHSRTRAQPTSCVCVCVRARALAVGSGHRRRPADRRLVTTTWSWRYVFVGEVVVVIAVLSSTGA